jgi:hypothetical protein
MRRDNKYLQNFGEEIIGNWPFGRQKGIEHTTKQKLRDEENVSGSCPVAEFITVAFNLWILFPKLINLHGFCMFQLAMHCNSMLLNQ